VSKCSNSLIYLPHRFRPPKKSDKKGWELVKFLISEGFPFQHIYREGSSELSQKASNNYVVYPKSMAEAREFVKKYQKYKVEEIDFYFLVIQFSGFIFNSWKTK
jgi:hypothetical protein